MKKALVLVTILALLTLTFALPVSAEGKLPWEDPNVKISMLTDFSSYADGEIDLATEPFWVGDQKPTLKQKWDQGRLVFTEADGTGAFFRLSDSACSSKGSTEGLFMNVEGLGFYVENNTAEEMTLGLFMLGFYTGYNANYAASADTVFYLVSTDGTITEGESSGDGTVYIPSGFKGYVNMDVSTFVNQWNSNAPWDPSIDGVNTPGFNIASLTVDPANDESFVIDNLYVYGENLDEDNTAFEVTQGATKAPTAAPTAAATSAAPAGNTNGSTASADKTDENTILGLSTVMFLVIAGGAVVVIAGIVIVAVVVSKNKKKADQETEQNDEQDK